MNYKNINRNQLLFHSRGWVRYRYVGLLGKKTQPKENWTFSKVGCEQPE